MDEDAIEALRRELRQKDMLLDDLRNVNARQGQAIERLHARIKELEQSLAEAHAKR